MDESHAPLFWQHVSRRLYAFLGRTAPILENGYQVVVALPGANFEHRATAVKRWASEAGLKDVVCIPAIDALFCRWLASEPADEAEVVALVMLGDTGCEVAARQVQRERGLLRAAGGSETIRLGGTGQAWWLRELLDVVRSRFKEALPPGYDLALKDAALEFGLRLGGADKDHGLRWTGVFHERMYAPLYVRRCDWLTWNSVAALELQLPDAIGQAVRAIGRQRLSRVVLGGPGVGWPFAFETVEGLAASWQSKAPLEDVAGGATWWPELGDHATVAVPAPVVIPASRAVGNAEASGHDRTAVNEHSPSPDEMETPASSQEVPPWERRHRS
jgi:hypothetical protein